MPNADDHHPSQIISSIPDNVSPRPEMDEHLAAHAVVHRLPHFREAFQLPRGVSDAIDGLARRLLAGFGQEVVEARNIFERLG